VGALLIDEDKTTVLPKGPEDVEGIQLFIGVRYLLLAPLYGYSLQTLLFEDQDFPEVVVLHDGIEEQYELNTFRFRIRAHVREELERAAAGARSAIDLSKVGEAETCSTNGDWAAVVGLLGSWPAPLAIFLRTPEGQMLTGDARHLIAKGLALLGTAYVNLGDMEQAEEVFRIGIQYAQEGVGAGDLFRRLGEAFLKNDRAGEAIGVLRRAMASGAEAREALPLLVRAFVDRKKYVAAFACIRQALEAGVPEKELAQELRLVEGMLGASVTRWKARLLQGQAPRP
jgi:tetratricopeptide (TPR) repeat protein